MNVEIVLNSRARILKAFVLPLPYSVKLSDTVTYRTVWGQLKKIEGNMIQVHQELIKAIIYTGSKLVPIFQVNR